MRSLALAFALFVLTTTAAHARAIRLWHSYRGGEEAALVQITRAYEAAHPGITVEALANPYENFASKLSTAIPNDNGPDLFIYAHERLGPWAHTGVIAPLDGRVPQEEWNGFLPQTLTPLEFEGRRWGLPLAFKSLALFYNRDLVQAPPATTEELLDIARRTSGGGRFGLAYQADNFFFHAPWFFGFGGELFPAAGGSGLDALASARSLAFVADLSEAGVMPAEPTGSLVSRLFNDGSAAMTINGPWFVGEIDPKIPFGVAPLPIVSATGQPARPFLTDEAVFLSARSAEPELALEFARYLAGPEAAMVRALKGHQLVASAGAWDDARLSGDPVLEAFRDQLRSAVPTPTHPQMPNLWEPATLALKKVLRHEATPELAASVGERRFRSISRPEPEKADPTPWVMLGLALLIGGAGLAIRAVGRVTRSPDRAQARLGWTWTAPALFATTLLVFVPFVIGLGLSLFDHHEGRFTFVGLAHFQEIVFARRFTVLEPLSFYYALVVTILWTAVNLALHVGIGLGLALLLNRPLLRLRTLYRVLLVVPWAVPNYITALLWKGLFHRQFGAINGLLGLLGLEPVAWFSSFGTAFFANVCTNAWLGFPFMMVVCLGALQAIPRELIEAADVDGASAWDRFRLVTWPLLQPALVPAMLLGVVWTFNAFNVVYLVSGGEPDNATDILVSEAYRWAFARQEQYGYAAAYAALIFLLLLGWSHLSQRLARRAETVP